MPRKAKMPEIFTGKDKKDPANRIVKRFAYYDSDGKRRGKTITAYSEVELAEKIVAWNNSIGKTQNSSMTVLGALTAYVDSKEPVLSPSTVRSYHGIISSRIAPAAIAGVKLCDLTTNDIQGFINSEIGLSPKTVKDHYMLLKSAVSAQRPFDFNVKLPQPVKYSGFTPSDAQVKALIDYTKGQDSPILYRAILLCAFGLLRRSEVCAIMDTDIHGTTISINKALVKDDTGAWVVKKTKTVESTRDIEYPAFVIDEIKDVTGRIIPINPDALSRRFERALRFAKLPHFGMHSLRRYGASIMHALNIPDMYIQQRGGWSSDYVMKRAYINSIDDEKKKQTDKINQHFVSILS